MKHGTYFDLHKRVHYYLTTSEFSVYSKILLEYVRSLLSGPEQRLMNSILRQGHELYFWCHVRVRRRGQHTTPKLLVSNRVFLLGKLSSNHSREICQKLYPAVFYFIICFLREFYRFYISLDIKIFSAMQNAWVEIGNFYSKFLDSLNNTLPQK